MKGRCIKVKIKSGSLNRVKEWYIALNNRKEEVLESMRNENIIVEAVFFR